MTVLILGGTAEARALAAQLVADDRPVVSSLAGRVSRPALPPGSVRVGGFGGVAGLVAYLQAERVTAVVDATHPFAARITANATQATKQTSIPLVRLERPSWREHPDSAAWLWVPDEASALVAGSSARHPFLTTGRQTLADFLPWADREVVVRVVDPPDFDLPSRWTLIRSRGPYDCPSEHRIMADHHVDLLVTKDSGGDHTAAKLDAARDLGVRVVVIARPPRPAGGVTVTSVNGVLDLLEGPPGRHASEAIPDRQRAQREP